MQRLMHRSRGMGWFKTVSPFHLVFLLFMTSVDDWIARAIH